jgi:pentatricopeptide repeat protein
MAPTHRIFISYRRSDSIGMTGRIHDRLVSAFGNKSVFKDMEDIPAGADFRAVINREVRESDVMVVVIGPTWLHTQNALGQRRLDDPDDFVRIEIETALARQEMLVIPLLLSDAKMPAADDLPPGMKELAFRNSANARNDPDFHRDLEQLIMQIKQHFGVNESSRARVPAALALVGLLLLVGGLWVFSRVTSPATATIPPATNVPTALALPTIEPAAAGQNMVLVAQFEPVRSPTPREVSRFIVEDLKQNLVNNVPFSKYAIRHYGAIITTDAEAATIAQTTSAAVIIWGSYSNDSVTANVQIGALSSFPNIKSDLATLRRTVNQHLKMTDERLQSLARPTIVVATGLEIAEGNVFEMLRAGVISDILEVEDPEPVGASISANVLRGMRTYYSDPQASLSYWNAVIQDDSANPFPYLMKSLLYMRENNLAAAGADVASAQKLGPSDWTTPIYVSGLLDALAGNWTEAIAETSKTVTLRPDDWYMIYWRGVLYYLSANYDASRADLEKSLTLNPTTNFPYLTLATLYLRDGRFEDAIKLFREMRARFPDFTFGNRVIEIGFGKDSSMSMAYLFSGFSKLLLGQYGAFLADTEPLVKANTTDVNLYWMRGLALCNLGKDKNAEAAYTQGLTLDSKHVMLYALRADARRRQGNVPGALADVTAVTQYSTRPQSPQYMQALLNNEVTCKNVFDFAETVPTVQPTP